MYAKIEHPRYGINVSSVSCPKCNRRMPRFRVPDGLKQLLFGGWTCHDCGCRMNQWGKAIKQENNSY